MLLTRLTAVVVLIILVGSREADSAESFIDKDKRHFEHGHSADLDHEAFLGKDHAQDYDDLSIEESKARLAALLPKVDADGDGDIDLEELTVWIKIQIMDFVERDAQKALPHEDENKDGIVSWEEYVTNTFGEQYISKIDDDDDDEDDDHYIQYVKRDKLRFNLADEDDDLKLNFQEFMAFLHPEEFDHMADVVLAETLDDMDDDNDGMISLAEYLGDFGGDDDDDDDDDDDEWIEREKKSFQDVKDKNKDGYLDREELADWVIPSEHNYSLDEAKHLIEKADKNKDGKLSYDEVLDNHDLFVGSQATDYGRILHEEL